MACLTPSQLLGMPLLACFALAGCRSNHNDHSESKTSSGNGGHTDEAGELREGLISFNGDPTYFAPMGYSAFDGNAHDYQVTPNVPSASDEVSAREPDPVVPSSLVWTVDDDYVSKQDDRDLNAAILLTTKKAGTTLVKVSGQTLSGIAIRGEAKLEVSKATVEEWNAGNMSYLAGLDDRWVSTGECSLPSSVTVGVSTSAGCSDCHNDESGITYEVTPQQTAGFSDDELIAIFSEGKKPDGYEFTSNILKYVPMPDCVYASFHTWKLDPTTKKGILWKLRSIKPKRPPVPPSGAALAAMFRRQNGAAGGAAPGAAGSGM